MAKTKKAAPEKLVLQAELRTEVGKKSRKLRKDGYIPANVFGQDMESKTIKVSIKDFTPVYKQAHETGVIHIQLGDETIPTLIAHSQIHPVLSTILHVDFRKVNLKKKIETLVPIMVVGESEAVKMKSGVLITQADHVYVEALPNDIPAHLEVDISKLTEIGQDIKVSDLAKSDLYTITEEPEKVILLVTAHKEESVTPETTAEEPEVIGENAEGEEGAAAEVAEGGEAAAPAEEGQSEEKSE